MINDSISVGQENHHIPISQEHVSQAAPPTWPSNNKLCVLGVAHGSTKTKQEFKKKQTPQLSLWQKAFIAINILSRDVLINHHQYINEYLVIYHQKGIMNKIEQMDFPLVSWIVT